MSFVGAWTSSANPEKATIPIWVDDPWLLMKSDAAASAASIRLGAMSVEHMLPDTSMASITVVWFVGTVAMTTGRLSASTRHATATATSANGRWRRRREEPGSASRTSDRLE